ncbi:iron-sulfur cluster assembly enzyme ISCU-like [Oncorhynchus masou masou]|uniref:iron-sulfur cluster assembly enzyme ISCU-like n=1 Tax=Oncorhynchus masou masou TaxID=90313 RepID=UPI003182C4F4
MHAVVGLITNNDETAYRKEVVDHYENPINVSSIDKNAKNVGTGLVGAPACGDVMKLQRGQFKKLAYVFCLSLCAQPVIRVNSINIDKALKIKNTDIANELCLRPVKLHCSMLAGDAIKAALADYRLKQKETRW